MIKNYSKKKIFFLDNGIISGRLFPRGLRERFICFVCERIQERIVDDPFAARIIRLLARDLFRTKFGKSNEYSTKPNTVYWYTGYDSLIILPPLV